MTNFIDLRPGDIYEAPDFRLFKVVDVTRRSAALVGSGDGSPSDHCIWLSTDDLSEHRLCWRAASIRDFGK